MITKSPSTPTLSQTTGMIVWNKRLHACNLPACLLIFDTESLVRATIVHAEDESVDSKADGLPDDADEFDSDVAELSAWQHDHSSPIRRRPDLALRIAVKPEVVNASAIGEYVPGLLAHSTKGEWDATYDFLLLSDNEAPTLYATNRNVTALRHTGNEILGVLVSQDELDVRITELVARSAINRGLK